MRYARNKGFTLVETLVYVFVLGLVVTMSSMTIISSLDVFAEVRADRAIVQTSSLVMERMTREIRQAYSVDTSNSVFGSTPGELILSVDEGGTISTKEFSLVGDEIVLTVDGTVVGSLSSSENVRVTSLMFYHITTATGDAIRVVYTLSENNTGDTATFYTTASLRGTY